jgi:hypothetical protein
LWTRAKTGGKMRVQVPPSGAIPLQLTENACG